MTKALSDAEQRSFASYKFELLDAMSYDIRLRGDPYRLAYRLLQHVNRRSMTAWPAIEKLAAEMGISRYQAQKHVKLLCDTGWLRRKRPNRRKPYEFRFLHNNINSVLDARESRLEELNDFRKHRSEVANKQHREKLDVVDPLNFDVEDPLSFDVADPQHKHLSNNPLNKTPDSLGIEEDGSNTEEKCFVA